MGNMSYCRFQNTLSDLDDCYEAMGNMMDVDEENLSIEEKRAKKALIKMCGDISQDFDYE